MAGSICTICCHEYTVFDELLHTARLHRTNHDSKVSRLAHIIRRSLAVASHNGGKGAGMGDKGGKKDKEKSKQQQVNKQKQEEQLKQNKNRPRTP